MTAPANTPNSPYIYLPLDEQAFGGEGAPDVLEYYTNTAFTMLEPSGNTLQFALFYFDDVFSASDTLTRGPDTVGVVASTAAVGAGFVSIVDIDSGLASILIAGDTVSNGTTSRVLSNVRYGVVVGGTSTNYWTTEVYGRTSWTPAGDHELTIPNNLASLFDLANLAANKQDMAVIWRQQWREFGGTPGVMVDFGSESSGAGSGGFALQPNVLSGTPDKMRANYKYADAGNGPAGFLAGRAFADNTDFPELVFSKYFSYKGTPRVDVTQYEPTIQFLGNAFNVDNGYSAEDVPGTLPDASHGHKAAIFCRINSDGTTVDQQLGASLVRASFRNAWLIWPENYALANIRNATTLMSKLPGVNAPASLGGI